MMECRQWGTTLESAQKQRSDPLNLLSAGLSDNPATNPIQTPHFTPITPKCPELVSDNKYDA